MSASPLAADWTRPVSSKLGGQRVIWKLGLTVATLFPGTARCFWSVLASSKGISAESLTEHSHSDNLAALSGRTQRLGCRHAQLAACSLTQGRRLAAASFGAGLLGTWAISLVAGDFLASSKYTYIYIYIYIYIYTRTCKYTCIA